MRRLALVLALAAVAAPAARAADPLGAAVQALRSDPVYIAPGGSGVVSSGQAGELRREIEGGGDTPIYVAVLPSSALAEAGGSADGVLARLASGIGDRGAVYATVVGGHFRAGPGSRAEGAATAAFDAHHGEGVDATLSDFVHRIDDGNGSGSGGGGGGGGTGVWPWVVIVVLVGGGFAIMRTRRGRRESEAFQEVKATANEDLVALASDVSDLDDDVEAPSADPRAKQHYDAALEHYSRASALFDRARRPDDLEPVTAALADGRYEMESAKALLQHRPLPERRPPCFFDPRHGTSVRDVWWQPPWGEAKEVPACARCATAVERGDEPDARHVLVGGRPTPFWNAPAYYGPWMGGYYGGFGGGGLLSGLLIGSMLGSAWGAPVAYGGSGWLDPGYGGGGDFGNGDGDGGGFDSGDFGGGGDFGGDGGDFGGGGGDF